jgi:hypothetical protein
VWRFKYLLIGMAFPALLGVAIYLTAPRIADWAEEEIQKAAAEEVEDAFQREVPDTVDPGQIVITEQQLLDALLRADANNDNFNADEYDVEIDNGQVRITNRDEDPASGQFSVATAVPVVENGRLLLTDRGGAVRIFRIARDAIGDAIEEEAAEVFQRSGVRPVSVTAENGRLVIVTESIGGDATPEPTEAGAPLGPTPTATRSLGVGPLNRTPTPTP